MFIILYKVVLHVIFESVDRMFKFLIHVFYWLTEVWKTREKFVEIYLSTSVCCDVFLKSYDIMNGLNRNQVNT